MIRTLKHSDIDQMYRTFLESFEDYPIKFAMDKGAFTRKFIEKLNIQFHLSAGAFHNEQMIGFVFSTVNDYEGLKTAYNGGTGVVPNHRGKGIARKMMEFLLPRYKVIGVQRCILEVLTDNERAIKTYENMGFHSTKRFKCFRLLPYRYNKPHSVKDLQIQAASSPDWKMYIQCFDFTPSFLDSRPMIDNNLKNEQIIEAFLGKEKVGYAIFQAPIGRISHLGVLENYRNHGVGSNLINTIYNMSENKYLTIINLIDSAYDFFDFLQGLGFENQLDQFEMALKIN